MLRVARGGANWVVVPLSLAVIVAGLAGPLGMPWLLPWSALPFFVGLWMMWFLRDPDRPTASGIVSPADGKVVYVGDHDDPDLGACQRLSIFMSLSSVHVNRAPLDADVRSVTHRPGGHVPAFNKDSHRNERVEYLLQTERGPAKLVQIAGAVARRIVPYAEAGDHWTKGDRVGLIRLGSRCDLLVPTGQVDWIVKVGDRVRANRSRVTA